MADYKTLRLKKNAELESAMSNIKKDLYNWKPPSNTVKINNYSKSSNVKLKSLDPSVRETMLIRSGSLRDINRPTGSFSGRSNSRKNSNNFNMKLRPISGDDRMKKNQINNISYLDLNDLEDPDTADALSQTEFLTSFKSTSNQSNERQYLYTTRPTSSRSLKKNSEEIEVELVNLVLNIIL